MLSSELECSELLSLFRASEPLEFLIKYQNFAASEHIQNFASSEDLQDFSAPEPSELLIKYQNFAAYEDLQDFSASESLQSFSCFPMTSHPSDSSIY
ncbi:hypothetical protein P8452_26965 [Trifolium repens]|nr:hypothetical protein P8452_26965 [Trifolium repens]